MKTKKSNIPLFSAANFFLSIFRFFASVKLAIVVLSTLMIVLIAGTLIESMHGADAAKLLVYDTPWFSVVLVILGLNVAAAAIDRLPWKKRHTGFVLTHCGIIMILAGSFITRHLMIDGQMAIQEGESEHRITLGEPLLYVYSQAEDRDWILPVPPTALPWTGRRELSFPGSPLTLHLLANYPKAEPIHQLDPAESGPGVIELTLKNSFMTEKLMLVENDPTRGFLNMGPAQFSFTDVFLTPAKETGDQDDPYLEFIFEKTKVLIPLEPGWNLPIEKPLQGTPYTIEITELYRNAVVDQNQLMEGPEVKKSASFGNNPAAVLRLKGEGFVEKHSVFANFPDFPTIHGREPSQTGARIFYRLPGAGSMKESHELRFVKKPVIARSDAQVGDEAISEIASGTSSPRNDEGLLYQIQNGPGVITNEAEAGKEVTLGWMDFQFRIDRYVPHAKETFNYRVLPNLSELETAVPVIRLEVAQGAEKEEIWLEQGQMSDIFIASTRYHFMYGQKRIPAGFKLELRDFRVENYPGTNRPASFESDVTLKDVARGVSKNVTISMNEPLEYQGFKIYQSGYHLEPGQPEISIFSVGRNPGVPLQYLGTIVMVIGIGIMYYTKKYSQNAGKLK